MFGDSGIGSEGIKNVRLTCKGLCNTSSHLLFQFLHFEISSASLAHLERVSSHSTIRKGVRTLRVVIDFYDSVLAEDFWRFADFSIDNLTTTIGFMELNVSLGIGCAPKHQTEIFRRKMWVSKTCFEEHTMSTDGDSLSNRLLLKMDSLCELLLPRLVECPGSNG